MMFSWQFYIRRIQENIDVDSIIFKMPKRYSPYMELSFENLNTVSVQESELEVNPYYRFGTIFNGMFSLDDTENKSIKSTLFDLIFHYLTELDCMQGMTKREFYIRFVCNDIERGLFGVRVAEDFQCLAQAEKQIIANNIIRLYKTGEGVYLFQDTVMQLFPKATIFAHIGDKDRLIIHLHTRETTEKSQKIGLLRALFLPFKYELEFYWEYIFGVLAEDAFMRQEEMMMY
ncbi:iron-dependent peroxidase [Listeria booriae]|uniref:Iron-dependent peroxidase n=1 Tax=Listeria booriae TaxID=1552123 RepID=A0A7X1A852_9LIST|nr:iron-dependent peroxidase [Listeria booriae]MBC1778412.1 iron-dependent peroxidase [Listeria booriae]MBC2241658.1 iron-dependent peroxidase [Listeria booriae]MBC2373034.1 iron-dependent peroxidase [Listeria booriae]MBC6301286.1 iron-dependent peroxidase [Listeria booriae]